MFIKGDLVLYVPNHVMSGNVACFDDILYENKRTHDRFGHFFDDIGFDELEWMVVSSVVDHGVFCKPLHAKDYGTSQLCCRENLLNISEAYRKNAELSDVDVEQYRAVQRLKDSKIIMMKKDAYEYVYVDGGFDIDCFYEKFPLETERVNLFDIVETGYREEFLGKYILLF